VLCNSSEGIIDIEITEMLGIRNSMEAPLSSKMKLSLSRSPFLQLELGALICQKLLAVNFGIYVKRHELE
jgi:hypothetical protein